VDTRYNFNTGGNVSGLFRVDTRFSGSWGSGVSGLFTVDTATAAQPSVSVSGRITGDGNGLAGATVSALFFNRVQASAMTDGNGNYTLPLLPPGTYEFRAARSSYASGIRRGVSLGTGASATVNFALNSQIAPPTTLDVTQSPPPQNQLPTTPTQLKVWNGTDFVTGLSLQPGIPTIVMTHGWNSSPQEWAVNTAQRLATALGAISRSANIAVWDWENAANTLPDGRATARTPEEGRALAKALIASLPGNDQSLHLIGHSLGSLVNARAADYLHKRAGQQFPAERTHVTILDNGTLANILRPILPSLQTVADPLSGALNTVDMLMDGLVISPFPERAAWIDNYVSLVGIPHRRAVNVFLPEGARFSESRLGWLLPVDIATGLHGYSHEWYRSSISQPFAGPLGHRHSFERQGDEVVFPYATGGRFEQDNPNDPFSLRRMGDYEVSFGLARVAAGTVGVTADGFGTIVGNTVRKVGDVVGSVTAKAKSAVNVALLVGDVVMFSVPRINLNTTSPAPAPFAKGGAVQLGDPPTNTPAYVWFDVPIPPDAAFMTFDYEVAGEANEDWVAFAINGTNQFLIAAEFVPEGVTQTTSMIDVSPWAGQTVEFFFGITGGTSTNATVAVDGIRFYSLPKPELLAKSGAPNQMVLNWPMSASDYLLEHTPTLGFSNVWTVVTNVPAVEDFQFALTNSLNATSGFYRLRKP
jgi:pimeloyl-ACP methyl ester carboxylesterase